MTLTEPGTVRGHITYEDEDEGMPGRTSGWYDPDAAAFQRSEPVDRSEPMTADDEAAIINWD